MAMLLITFLGVIQPSYAQYNEAFLYAEVRLKSGEKVKGQLRWGNEELMWDDMFWAFKVGAPFGSKENLTLGKQKEQNSVFSHFNFDFMQLWENRGQQTRYNFKCHFGDINKIKIISDTRAQLFFKNGQRVMVTKNQENDIGATLRVFSFTGVVQKITWRQISEIQFLPFPEGRASTLGNPIYGRIETTNGVFEGFIAWNKKERVGTDKLNGYKDGEKENISFSLIKKVEVEGDGSLVTLLTGEKILLRDHRDVNYKNKGIIIKQKGLGHILVHWEELISADFFYPPERPMFYRDFYITHYLQGTVTDKNGNTFLGRLVYDMDEYLSLEVLDGTHNNTEYLIPFKYISSIKKQNSNYTKLCLRSGEELLLAEHPDVTAENQGIIIEAYGRKNLYVSWREFKYINFKP